MTEPKPPALPQRLEALLKKAAVDPAFAAALLARRGALADEIGFPLEASERAMLDRVPEAQLRQVIARLPVPEPQRRVLLGCAAGCAATAAVVALAAYLALQALEGERLFQPIGEKLGGIRTDLPDPRPPRQPLPPR